MEYDWPEIVRKKKLEELVNIVNGCYSLPIEAENAAKNELIARGFNLNEKQNILNQIRLDTKIEDEKARDGFIGRLLYQKVKFNRTFVRIFLSLFAITLSTFSVRYAIINGTKEALVSCIATIAISLLCMMGAYFLFRRTK